MAFMNAAQGMGQPHMGDDNSDQRGQAAGRRDQEQAIAKQDQQALTIVPGEYVIGHPRRVKRRRR